MSRNKTERAATCLFVIQQWENVFRIFYLFQHLILLIRTNINRGVCDIFIEHSMPEAQSFLAVPYQILLTSHVTA